MVKLIALFLQMEIEPPSLVINLVSHFVKLDPRKSFLHLTFYSDLTK